MNYLKSLQSLNDSWWFYKQKWWNWMELVDMIWYNQSTWNPLQQTNPSHKTAPEIRLLPARQLCTSSIGMCKDHKGQQSTRLGWGQQPTSHHLIIYSNPLRSLYVKAVGLSEYSCFLLNCEYSFFLRVLEWQAWPYTEWGSYKLQGTTHPKKVPNVCTSMCWMASQIFWRSAAMRSYRIGQIRPS